MKRIHLKLSLTLWVSVHSQMESIHFKTCRTCCRLNPEPCHMFHITPWISPDLTVIISALPSSPSSSLHLRPSPPLLLLFHPSYPLPPPPLCTPPWIFYSSSSSSTETMFETWYHPSGSIRLVAVTCPPPFPSPPSGPSAPHLLSDLDVSHAAVISCFFSLSFLLFLSISYPVLILSASLHLSLWGLSSRLSSSRSVPSLH